MNIIKVTTSLPSAALPFIAAFVVLFFIAKWKVFEKMGLAGWLSLIPIYSEYLIFKKSWCGKMFFVAIFASAFGKVLFDAAVKGSSVNIPLALMGAALISASIFIDLKTLYLHAKAFGHGFGYTLGFALADPIFTIILGFDNSVYAEVQ